MRKRKNIALTDVQPLLLSVKQVAAKLGVCPATVYGYINKEGLPTVKLGNGTHRVYEISLLKWIQQHEEQHSA